MDIKPLIIDYIDLLVPNKEQNNREQWEKVLNELKQLAGNKKIKILVIDSSSIDYKLKKFNLE